MVFPVPFFFLSCPRCLSVQTRTAGQGERKIETWTHMQPHVGWPGHGMTSDQPGARAGKKKAAIVSECERLPAPAESLGWRGLAVWLRSSAVLDSAMTMGLPAARWSVSRCCRRIPRNTAGSDTRRALRRALAGDDVVDAARSSHLSRHGCLSGQGTQQGSVPRS